MVFHEPDPASVFVPLILHDEATGKRHLIHEALEVGHIRAAYPRARIIRGGHGGKGRPKCAIIGGDAPLASHIGAREGGNTYREKLESGHRLWAMRFTRERGNRANSPQVCQ